MLPTSSFLDAPDLARLLLTSRCLAVPHRPELRALGNGARGPLALPGAARSVAANRLARWWLLVRFDHWLNAAAAAAVRIHAFPHRTETNYVPWRRHYGGGIVSIDRLRALRRFGSRLREAPVCPRCSAAPASAVVYKQVGCKMVSSTPHVDLYCRMCVQQAWCWEDEHVLVSHFGQFKLARTLHWHAYPPPVLPHRHVQ